jgi:hypothetical protein
VAQREAGLRRTLADFLGAIPVQIAWVDAIPTTRLGKAGCRGVRHHRPRVHRALPGWISAFG